MADFDREYQARVQTAPRADTRALDDGLRAYMLRVYNYMALGVAGTAVVTLLVVNSPAALGLIAGTPLKWVLFAAILGLGFFSPRLIFSGNQALAHICFWTYAALWGALIAPMVYYFLAGGLEGLIFRALAITAATFGAMSLLGYVTKRDLSGFGTFFMMATIGLLIAIVLNVIFFQSEMLSLVTSGLVVLVFSGITAYETQAIKEMYVESDGTAVMTSKSIFGAFMLYGSFVTLFIHILNILGIMQGD